MWFYCCLPPQCEALRTCRSEFPIVTIPLQLLVEPYQNSMIYRLSTINQTLRIVNAGEFIPWLPFTWGLSCVEVDDNEIQTSAKALVVANRM